MANRIRRTYAELFLDKLSELSDGEQQLIGNMALRNQLGWDEDRYERVKAQLYEGNLIILRPCLWKHAPFSKLQALPEDAKAVSLWADRDEAMTNIVDGIRRIAEGILASE